jgi:hypothetical protein
MKLLTALKRLLFIFFMTAFVLLIVWSFTTSAWWTIPCLLVIGIWYALRNAQQAPDDYEDF